MCDLIQQLPYFSFPLLYVSYLLFATFCLLSSPSLRYILKHTFLYSSPQAVLHALVYDYYFIQITDILNPVRKSPDRESIMKSMMPVMKVLLSICDIITINFN